MVLNYLKFSADPMLLSCLGKLQGLWTIWVEVYCWNGLELIKIVMVFQMVFLMIACI